MGAPCECGERGLSDIEEAADRCSFCHVTADDKLALGEAGNQIIAENRVKLKARKACTNCSFFAPYKCKRNPPSEIGYPEVERLGWCGEFVNKHIEESVNGS